jgi:hypothetical protein
LWYYRSLLKVYTGRGHDGMVTELRDAVDTLARAIGQPA